MSVKKKYNKLKTTFELNNHKIVNCTILTLKNNTNFNFDFNKLINFEKFKNVNVNILYSH